MDTLWFIEILSVLFVELVGLTSGPNGLSGVDSFSIFGLAFDSDKWFFYLAWAVSLLLMWGILNLVRSRIGRAITSLDDSGIGAASLGINTYGCKVAVFMLFASLAALAGSLYVRYIRVVTSETLNLFAYVLGRAAWREEV